MIELREVEKEIDKAYKEKRIKEKKEAVKAMKRNPNFFLQLHQKVLRNKQWNSSLGER